MLTFFKRRCSLYCRRLLSVMKYSVNSSVRAKSVNRKLAARTQHTTIRQIYKPSGFATGGDFVLSKKRRSSRIGIIHDLLSPCAPPLRVEHQLNKWGATARTVGRCSCPCAHTCVMLRSAARAFRRGVLTCSSKTLGRHSSIAAHGRPCCHTLNTEQVRKTRRGEVQHKAM